MIIGLDIDGVLRDFTSQLIDVYERDHPTHIVQPISQWHFHDSFPIGKDIYKYYVDNAERIFLYAQPYPAAQYFVMALKEEGHTVKMITTQPPGTEIFTLEWLKNNDFVFDTVDFTGEKYKVPCDIYLDDAPHNILALQQHKKNAIIYDQPWNYDTPGKRVSSYHEFMELL